MLRLILGLFFFFFSVSGCYSMDKRDVAVEESEDETVDPYFWDFGEVRQGDILRHTFILKNTSPATLNIKDVTTSCGCTVSAVKSKTIPPDESTEIEVKFDTKKYSGAVEQFIYVNTDRLDNPIIRYIIKTNVVK